jgi:hypothetical protein
MTQGPRSPEPEKKPPMEDPPIRKGPLGDPSGEQPVRRDPPPKTPEGEPKEIGVPEFVADCGEILRARRGHRHV